MVGVRETAAECIVEEDRAGAIAIAIRAARAGDVVLIAGKGHEKVQIFADGSVPFDDVAVARGGLAWLVERRHLRVAGGRSMKLTLGQIADWIHAEGDFTTEREAVGYSIDSRTIGAGELFFAVKGERVDGHDYVATALANGAVAAVVSQHWLAPDEMDPCRLLRVPESEDCVLRAMQTLAHRVRRAWGGRVIGVTGSAGKTTTKEMVAAVLSGEVPGDEERGQSEQSLRPAAAAAEAGAGARGRRDRDGDEPCGRDCGAGEESRSRTGAW